MVQQMVLVMFPKYLKRAMYSAVVGYSVLQMSIPSRVVNNAIHIYKLMCFTTLLKFLTIISSKVFSAPFSLSSISGAPIRCMLICLKMSQRSLRFSSLFYNIFLFFRLDNFYFSSSSLAFRIQSAVRST